MADTRISALPAITAAETADADLLPIVDQSAGANRKMTFGEAKAALSVDAQAAQAAAEAAQAAAELAEANAEAARDAAFVNADVYATTALGLAAVALNDQFTVISGDEAIRYREDAGPVATEVARYPTSAINALVRFERYISAYPKIGGVVTTTGGALNGASFWDGSTTVGATQASGGMFIPTGSTGHQSYSRYQFAFSAARSAELAGRTVKFIVPLVTSNGLMDAIPAWTYGGAGSPTSGAFANRVIKKITGTLALFSFDYTFVGTETQVSAYPQINNGVALGADHHWHSLSGYYVALDKDGFSDVMEQFLATLEAELRSHVDYAATTDTAPKIEGGTWYSEVFNGAVYNTPGDQMDGFTVPAGSTGYQSYYRGYFLIGPGRAQSLIGKTARFVLELETSSDALAARNYSASATVQRVTGTTDPLGTFSNIAKIQLTPTRAVAVADFTFTGVEQDINILFQQITNSAGDGTENSITPVSLWYTVIGAEGFADAVLQNLPSETQYIKTVVVKPDGSGDYTTLKAAILAEGPGLNTLRRVKYEVHEGVYTDIEYSLPAFADIVGIGRRENVWLKGYQAASTAIATIEQNSTVRMNETTRIENIKITCQNMRYPIHSDSSASAKRATQEIHNCHIEHVGNDEARDYQTSIGGTPAAVWTSEQAWGCGTHSGQRILSSRTRWVGGGVGTAFGFHTNKDFTEGNYVELDQCQIINQKGGNALGMNENGSKVPHEFVLNGCEVQGSLWVTSGSWLSTSALVDQGDRTGMCRVHISGCSPIAWTSDNTADVLELRSVDSASSAVTVSGTGADALFGLYPVYRLGGIGYPARAYSQHIVNGVTGTWLGARLGDCTVTSKTLTIAFDGGAAANLTLNQDYTAMSNATVISALNTLMADGAGRAFYQTNAYDNEAPVYQLDREVTVKNTSADTMILKGMAVAYDGALHLGRIATSTDARKLIAGIALENIAPGMSGRVLKSGHIAQAQVLFSGTPALVFGDECGVSATAGRIVEGASLAILRMVGSAVLEILS